MAITETTVKRTTVASGTDIKTGHAGDNQQIQYVFISDDDGNATGIASNPLPVEFAAAQAVTATISGTPAVTLSGSANVVSLKRTLTNFVTGETAVFSVANVATGACTLYELDCVLAVGSTTDYTVMLFDSTTVPADDSDPYRRYLVPSEGMIHLEFPTGLAFATGLSICFSTTRDDKTIATAVAGSAGGWFQGLYGAI